MSVYLVVVAEVAVAQKTVTAIEDPQAPYTPVLAANTDVLNLKDNGNVDVESVENTARLVSVFYDEVIKDIFVGLGLPRSVSTG